MALLTDTRDLLWQAIDNHAALSGQFKRKLKHNARGGELAIGPGFGDLPAISIKPRSGESAWQNNQQQRLTVNFEIVFWTPDDDIRLGETLMEEVVKAIYQIFETAGTNSYSRVSGPINWGLSITTLPTEGEGGEAEDVGPLCTQWLLTFPAVSAIWNPRTA